jgi:uncharacterized membrane protein
LFIGPSHAEIHLHKAQNHPIIAAMEALVFLIGSVLIGTPILAILAYTRVQRLSEQVGVLRPQDLIGRIYALEQRLDRIEKLVQSGTAFAAPASTSEAQADESLAATQAPHHPAATDPASQVSSEARNPVPPSPKPSIHPANKDAVSPTPSAPSGPRPPVLSTPAHAPHDLGSRDLESLIGGSWFNRLGILALIVAVSLFLKYAFDNNWIGASGRIAIGLLLGAAMLPWSQWLLGRGYSYFSEGIAALGQATLLLSIWAGCRYYTLFSLDVGFAAMIGVTAVMAAVAIGRNSERIAVLSLIGGFLTPMLLSTGRDQEVALFVYLLILGAGLLVIAAFRDWRSLAPLSFFLTQIYFWG